MVWKNLAFNNIGVLDRNGWFLAAMVSSGITGLTHVFLGGREVAKRLVATDGLVKMSKYTNYYCRHMVTIVLAAQTLTFWLVIQSPDERSLALVATGGAIVFMLWNVIMIANFKLGLRNFPQWILFFPTALLGLAGLYL